MLLINLMNCHRNLVLVKILVWDHFFRKNLSAWNDFSKKNGPGLKILFRIQFLIKNANPAALHLLSTCVIIEMLIGSKKLRLS